MPTASSSTDCRLAGDCRLAQPTFACNLDDAARIAGAGPEAGREAGLAAIRAGTCEIVAAGRSLRIEATKASNVVYATEQGRHVGYLPVGVFAPADQAGTIACQPPGFCAVRLGAPAWICPHPNGLGQPTPEAKRAAGCLQVSSNVAAEVAPGEGNTVVLLNMVGGSPPVPTRYHVARGDLVGLDLQPAPTPTGRGWCRPGDWCVLTVGTLFCWDRAAHERIMSLPVGETRRAAIMSEPECRLLVPGSPLKPKGVPAANDPRKLIEVEHPVLKTGVASANAFKVVSYNPPIRYTSQVSDIVVGMARAPAFAAIEIRAQGTSGASGMFRAGPRERRVFCTTRWEPDQTTGLNSCLSESDATLKVTANCEARRVALDGRQYGLLERPRDAAPDIHVDEHRRMLYRDLTSGEWLDGSTVSGEAMVITALNALCPSVDPEASFGLVYRDPRAAFPRELQGRWYDDRGACADPRRKEEDYDNHGWMVITNEGRVGSREYEWLQRVNAVRATGRGAWEIDGSHRIDDATVPEIFQTSTYRLTRDGFVLRQQGRVSEWVRCQ